MWVSVSFFVLCFRKKGTDRLKRCKTAETLLVKSINYTRSKKMKDKIFSVLQRVGRSFMLPIAICIFRKNCASVPEERSAIPLQTEQSSAG